MAIAIEHKRVAANGINFHVAVAGYAPDLRGYGAKRRWIWQENSTEP